MQTELVKTINSYNTSLVRAMPPSAGTIGTLCKTCNKKMAYKRAWNNSTLNDKTSEDMTYLRFPS